MPSLMTFNGNDYSNILYSDDDNHGIVKHFNQRNSSTWTFKIHDATWNNKSIFRTYRSASHKKQLCDATISTASNYIKVPLGDFSFFAKKLRRAHSEFTSNGTSIYAEKPCSHFDLHNLTLVIDNLYYTIPDTYWKRTINGRCEILISTNLNTDIGLGTDGYLLG